MAPSLVRHLPPELAALATARSAVRTWLEESAVVPESLHEELMLAGTELCTEAIEQVGTGPIILRAWTDHEFVVLEVEGPETADVRLRTVRPLWHDEVIDLRKSILQSVCDDVSRSRQGAARLVRCRKRMS